MAQAAMTRRTRMPRGVPAAGPDDGEDEQEDPFEREAPGERSVPRSGRPALRRAPQVGRAQRGAAQEDRQRQGDAHEQRAIALYEGDAHVEDVAGHERGEDLVEFQVAERIRPARRERQEQH